MSRHLLGHRQSRGFEKRRREVGERYEVGDRAPALDRSSPTNRQRDVGAGVIKRGLAAGEWHAVVAAHDDDRVVELLTFPVTRAFPQSES